MASYIAVIHKEKDSCYGVSFPDFPGCVSAGSTLDEARIMAQEALELHIEGMKEDGEALPKPSALDFARVNDAAAYFVVSVQPAKKPVRINASFDPELLAAIDAKVAELGTTRSGYLAQLAQRELGI